MNKWIVCRKGKGHLYKNGSKERLETNSVREKRAHITPDADTLSNCEALCGTCHKNTGTYGV